MKTNMSEKEIVELLVQALADSGYEVSHTKYGRWNPKKKRWEQ